MKTLRKIKIPNALEGFEEYCKWKDRLKVMKTMTTVMMAMTYKLSQKKQLAVPEVLNDL
ncbi:hypothetical protein X975_05461, partial [Stegodyphus mimosarum]